MERKYESNERRYARYEILDYGRIETAENPEGVATVIVDIGLGGVQVRTREPMRVGAICRVYVGQVDGKPLILRGEIRHSSMVGDGDLFAAGVRFMPETHEERIAIAQFVHGVFQRQCDLLGA